MLIIVYNKPAVQITGRALCAARCDKVKGDGNSMRVEQLFDPVSSTYSYLVWDTDSREAALIDPVNEQTSRDANLVRQLGLTLKYTLETHVHADHTTGSDYFKKALNSIVIMHENSRTKCADVLVRDGDYIPLGHQRINILFTPGHTDNHICYTLPGVIFTGDSLLIGTCGRTDYRTGNAAAQYESITGKLFAYPDETMIYPGHDYHGKTRSTIGEEKAHNPQIGAHISREKFIDAMVCMKLDPPQRLHEALPSAMRYGIPGRRTAARVNNNT
jgi:glyoxylase-like metal-dependent hydrolase (beta-lactamase superfamily II)